MTTPFVLAVPSKGRLQENAEAFFTHAGLSLAKPRGARDYSFFKSARRETYCNSRPVRISSRS